MGWLGGLALLACGCGSGSDGDDPSEPVAVDATHAYWANSRNGTIMAVAK
jgi:hypothetical protein